MPFFSCYVHNRNVFHFSGKKRLIFLASYAMFYVVPHPEEALYLREPTGELLHSGSPGFLWLLKIFNFKEISLFLISE